jgi:hypothetical protein
MQFSTRNRFRDLDVDPKKSLGNALGLFILTPIDLLVIGFHGINDIYETLFIIKIDPLHQKVHNGIFVYHFLYRKYSIYN